LHATDPVTIRSLSGGSARAIMTGTATHTFPVTEQAVGGGAVITVVDPVAETVVLEVSDTYLNASAKNRSLRFDSCWAARSPGGLATNTVCSR
jgi:hypothetical protein